MGRQKKKLSDFDENGTNRLETIKSGANLFSDQKVDFLDNWVSVAGARLVYTLISHPSHGHLPITPTFPPIMYLRMHH